MTRPVSAMLIAKNTIRVQAISTIETSEIDFEMGPDEGVEILGLKSIWGEIDQAVATTITEGKAQASLHMEDETLTDPNLDVDDNVRSSEVVHASLGLSSKGDDSGAAAGGMTSQMTAIEGPIENFPRPLITLVNLTHRLETDAVINDVYHTYLIYYRYVKLSPSELAVEFQRRR